MRIIGLAGAAGSGKDTIADWLVAHRGFVKVAFADEMKRFVHKVFPWVKKEHLWGPSEMRGALVQTQPVENYLQVTSEFVGMLGAVGAWAALVGWVEQHRASGSTTVRVLLQTLGTEWGRAFDPLLWVRDVFNRQVPEIQDPSWWGWKKEWGAVPEDRPDLWGKNMGGPRGVVITDHRFTNEVEYTKSQGGQVWLIRRPGNEKPLVGGVPGHASENGFANASFNVEVDVPEGLHKVPFLVEALYNRFG